MNIVVCVKQVPDTAVKRTLRPCDDTLDRHTPDGPVNPTGRLRDRGRPAGFDTPTFTPIFVAACLPGWTAHITEQLVANSLIRPLAAYAGPAERHLPKPPLRERKTRAISPASGSSAAAGRALALPRSAPRPTWMSRSVRSILQQPQLDTGRIEASPDRTITAGKLNDAERDAALEWITIATDLDDQADRDLVVEAATKTRDVKDPAVRLQDRLRLPLLLRVGVTALPLHPNGRLAATCGGRLPTVTKQVQRLDHAVIRFADHSGDGMQLAGDRFTRETAVFGNDLSTPPDFPAEIRAPAGTQPRVSSFQLCFADHDVLTPGDAPDVLIAMTRATLKASIRDLSRGGAGARAGRDKGNAAGNIANVNLEGSGAVGMAGIRAPGDGPLKLRGVADPGQRRHTRSGRCSTDCRHPDHLGTAEDVEVSLEAAGVPGRTP
jgi:Citrate synthase, C-terminal domain/3-hydroxyacyl-CoA dehydrogenase, NAD binding domain